MSDKKKSFVLYLDQQDLFNKLPDEVAGKLIKHIFSYVNCENPETDDLLLNIAFSPIKQSLKRDLNKWKAQLQQRSEAGKRSAEKRANEKQRKATTVESRSTKSTDSVNVSVSGSVSDSNKYAFLGETIRLTHDDFKKWSSLYPNVSLYDELTQLDMECRGDKKWFMTVSSKLNYRNKNAKPISASQPRAFKQ